MSLHVAMAFDCNALERKCSADSIFRYHGVILGVQTGRGMDMTPLALPSSSNSDPHTIERQLHQV